MEGLALGIASCQIVLKHESETFNVGDETLRKRMERSVADHDVES